MSKILFKTEHLILRETEKGFIYAQRRNYNSTAGLCFKKTKFGEYEFLIRYQPLPEIVNGPFKILNWDFLFPCCVTGSFEENESPLLNIIREIFEETNIIIRDENIVDSCYATASTQSNELVYTFLIDVTNCEIIKKNTGDGSIFENISKNEWVSHQYLKDILFNNKEIYLSSLASAYLLFIKNFLIKI